MDYIKLAQRTIAMLSSMIESGECHTTRSKEMKDNAVNGLEQLRLHSVVGRSEQLVCEHKYQDNVCDWRGVRKCIICGQMEKAIYSC